MTATDTRDPAADPAPNAFARQLFTGLPARYDLLQELLSFGQNARWRRTMVDHALACRPTRVLDVATGTAGVALQLADRGVAEVVGVDLTPAMLRRGQAAVRRRDAPVQLVRGRAEELPFPDASFDALTFTYLLRYVADPAATLAELVRVVRPGGIVASLEFAVPDRPVWRAAWRLHTRVVLPVAGGLLGGPAWARVGRFLGPNIERHYRRYPLPWLLDAWRDAGLTDVGLHRLSLGGGVVVFGRKP